MAATTHISFSWALAVDALTFRANLEAYTNLRPTLELLHLCKRSENCRLPVDILEMIESLLLEDERARCRENFAQLLKCYESRCEQADHFEQDIRERIEAEPERDSILPFASLPFAMRYFTAPMWRIIRSNAVPGLNDKIQEYRIACKTKHHQNVDLWQTMDVTRRGIGVLRDDFGLCSRSVDYGDHTNASRWQKPPGWLHCSARYINLRARSVTYLHLPETTNVPYCFGVYPKKSDSYREFELPEYIGPTVTDWTRQPAMPETPSVQSLSRFTRAIKILGLRPSNEVESGKSSEDREQQPALTMFVVDQYSDRNEEEESYA